MRNHALSAAMSDINLHISAGGVEGIVKIKNYSILKCQVKQRDRCSYFLRLWAPATRSWSYSNAVVRFGIKLNFVVPVIFQILMPNLQAKSDMTCVLIPLPLFLSSIQHN